MQKAQGHTQVKTVQYNKQCTVTIFNKREDE